MVVVVKLSNLGHFGRQIGHLALEIKPKIHEIIKLELNRRVNMFLHLDFIELQRLKYPKIVILTYP